MSTLEDQLKEVQRQEGEIQAKIRERNKQRPIRCTSCGKDHAIESLEAVQTQRYIPPSGHTNGDYWVPGELRFICPETQVANRLLFNIDDVPWEERKKHEHNAEEQFKRLYSGLFKSIKDFYIPEDRGADPGPWVNNYHVDQHRKKFGLVEKRKPASS